MAELRSLLTLNVVHERYGFFDLISDEVKDRLKELSLYRMRDVVEKAFCNVKERLDLLSAFLPFCFYSDERYKENRRSAGIRM